MYAPAQHTATVWHALTLLADAARTPGDHRSTGNRRCDALTDLCHGILRNGHIPGQPPCTHHTNSTRSVRSSPPVCRAS